MSVLSSVFWLCLINFYFWFRPVKLIIILNKFANKSQASQQMNDLHKGQLKLSYQLSYANSNTRIINVEELKRANSRLSKNNPQRTSGSLLAYMVKNRKAAYEDNKDELLDYDDFEQRVDSFIRQN